jgi:uncharacterized BrkB/YihY/UPF0761 family membrane protein
MSISKPDPDLKSEMVKGVSNQRFSLNRWLKKIRQRLTYRRRRMLLRLLVALVVSVLAVLSALIVVQVFST